MLEYKVAQSLPKVAQSLPKVAQSLSKVAQSLPIVAQKAATVVFVKTNIFQNILNKLPKFGLLIK